MRPPGRPQEFVNLTTTTINFEPEELKAFKETAARQGKTMSSLMREWAKEYVKAHQENDQTKVDSYVSPTFIALPTVWDVIGKKELSPYSWKDCDDMLRRLDSARTNIARDRQEKRDAELKAKGLRV